MFLALIEKKYLQVKNNSLLLDKNKSCDVLAAGHRTVPVLLVTRARGDI